MIWENKTPYRSSDADRTPRLWEAKIGVFRLSLASYNAGCDQWVISCPQLLFDNLPLRATDTEEAKKEALERFKGVLSVALGAM